MLFWFLDHDRNADAFSRGNFVDKEAFSHVYVFYIAFENDGTLYSVFFEQILEDRRTGCLIVL